MAPDAVVTERLPAALRPTNHRPARLPACRPSVTTMERRLAKARRLVNCGGTPCKPSKPIGGTGPSEISGRRRASRCTVEPDTTCTAMNCPACQHENPAGSAFCEECGVRLERQCPSCGSPCTPAAKFCRSCGAALTGGAAKTTSDEAVARKVVTIVF